MLLRISSCIKCAVKCTGIGYCWESKLVFPFEKPAAPHEVDDNLAGTSEGPETVQATSKRKRLSIHRRVSVRQHGILL